MKYTNRHGIQKFKIRIINLSTALIVGVTGLTSAAPLIMTHTAFAEGNHSVCASGCEFDNLQSAIDSPLVASHDTIQLASDLNTTAQINITKSVTIDGQGHTLTPTFSKTSSDNNATILVTADYVSIENITLNGISSTNLHGVNLYGVQGFSLNSSTLTNFDHYGLVVNGSIAIVNDITTSGNGWGGIDVDQGSNVTSRANLAVGGYSNQSETIAIKIDDVTKNVSVDANDQYESTSAYPALIYTQLQPQLSAENFNTVNDASYKGISVGFNASNFVGYSLSGVTVEILRSDGTTATLWGSQDLVNLIRSNQAPHQFTAPFVIQTGTYDSSKDTYWQQGGHTAWTASTVPVSATITLNYGNGEPKTVTNTNFSQGSPSWPTYAELIPSTVPDAPVPTAPLNNSVVHTKDVTLSWKPSTNAVAYAIDISSSPEFRSGYGFDTGNVTSVNPTSDPDMHSFTDGVYYWRIQARDAAGHWGSYSVGQKFTVDTTTPADTTAPSVPVNGKPNGSYLKTNDFDFTWDASTDDTSSPVTYEFQSSMNPAVDSNGVLTTGLWKSGTLNDATIHSQGAPFSTWYWQVRAHDAAGNYSAWSPVWNVTLDNVNPTSTNDLASLVHGKVTITQTVTDNTAPASGKLRIWKLTNGVADNSKFFAIGDKNVDAHGVVTYDLDTVANLFGDGEYIAKFTSTDKAGNASVQQQTFTVDNTAPTITVKPGYVGNEAQKLFSNVSFKLHDNNAVDYYTVNGHKHELTNNPWSDANFQNFKSQLVEGENTITVYDVAGNSTTYTFTYDSTAPTGTFAYSNNNGNEVTNKDVTVTLTTSEPVNTPDGWTKVAGTDDTFTKVYSQNGKYSVDLKDPAGNMSTLNYEVKRIDKVAPVINGVVDGHLYNGAVPYTVTEQSISELLVDGVAVTPVHVSGWDYTGPAVTGDGAHTIKVTDKAGNTASVSFSIDTTAPTVTIASYGQSGNVLQPKISVDGSATPTGYTYSWTTDPNVTISNTSALNPTITANKFGQYSLTLTVKDTAGNSTDVPFNFVYSNSGNTNQLNKDKGQPNSFHNVSTTTPNQNGNSTPQQLSDNGNGTTTPQVLGASTDKDSKVKSDTINLSNDEQTGKDNAKNSSAFIGLGWWWLLVLAVVLALGWFVLGRRSNSTDHA